MEKTLMQRLKKLCKRITPAGILAILFLVYICYVGYAAFPDFVKNTGSSYYSKAGLTEYINTIDEQYEGMLTTSRDNLFLQNKANYINFNGAMARLLHQPVMNERLMLKNGHLTTFSEKGLTDSYIQNAAENIIRFSKTLEEQGKNFLYVQAPSQISKYENLLPTGYKDTANSNADKLIAQLRINNVEVLDLREELQNEGISITDAFYVTDHHWLPETGFWAYTKILQKLEAMNATGPIDTYYTNPDNFTFNSYEDTFLGSSGKRTGIYYAGLDDSTIIQPNFDTDITFVIPSWGGLTRKGRYEDISYNQNIDPDYSNPDFYKENVYGLYGWGDLPLSNWRNVNAPETAKFLLIGDSYANVPFSLMSLYISSCDEVDMRHFTDDFTEYFDNYDPDTVIFLIGSGSISSNFTKHPYLEQP